MTDRNHLRRCHCCGLTDEYTDNTSPACDCNRCGSEDTRPLRPEQAGAIDGATNGEAPPDHIEVGHQGRYIFATIPIEHETPERLPVCRCASPEIARRIVASYNATAGLPVESLEGDGVAKLLREAADQLVHGDLRERLLRLRSAVVYLLRNETPDTEPKP